jgi:hypothetical protein
MSEKSYVQGVLLQSVRQAFQDQYNENGQYVDVNIYENRPQIKDDELDKISDYSTNQFSKDIFADGIKEIKAYTTQLFCESQDVDDYEIDDDQAMELLYALLEDDDSNEIPDQVTDQVTGGENGE